MDPDKKAALDLIEAVAKDLPVPDRGKQLMAVARDYVDDGDLPYAREVLGKIEATYFEEFMYQQAAEDTLFAEVVADVIEVFGLGFSVLARPVSFIN
jgi:hypothetical protein